MSRMFHCTSLESSITELTQTILFCQDTFAFAFPSGFPPLKLEPTGLIAQLLPNRGSVKTKVSFIVLEISLSSSHATDNINLLFFLALKLIYDFKLGASSESVCKLHRGIKTGEIATLNAVVLFKFIGIGVSFSNRLEYGSNKYTRYNAVNEPPLIYDGFVSIPLPPKPSVDFWTAFT